MPLIIQPNSVHTFSMRGKPMRIVSLVPSQTELLYDLGLEKEVVGITKFCIRPTAWFRQKERIGGTKTVNIARVKALKPDLILANKEENVKEQLDQLAEMAPVWVSDISNLNDALNMIETIGTLTGKETESKELVEKIERSFSNINIPKKMVKTVYLIWQNPYMAAGGDTFINDMLKRCGLSNVLVNEMRYPVVSFDTNQQSNRENGFDNLPTIVNNDNCDLVLLSSEPYPFKKQHIKDIRKHLPSTTILLADGEMFSWYGSRLLYSAAYFNNLLENL